MQWSDLLNTDRFGDANYEEQANRPIYVQDLDRIAFSAPFRRLANKTQVHPLYDHDHIHHRLIHSVETASVGRSLGMAVGHWLEENEAVQPGEKHIVSGMVQAACMAHDIGNPPFGHSGEEAIGQWFSDRFGSPVGILAGMNENLRSEFLEFEGNAQGFRILTRLEMYRNEGGMRLSNGVLGAFTKYPVTAQVKNGENIRYCGLKKFGIFNSDVENYEALAEKLGLIKENGKLGSWWRRHPLVFLVEAADDICYNILDVEDAFTTGDLSFEVVVKKLSPLAGASNQDLGSKTEEEQIAYLRARGIGAAIQACVDAFIEHYDEIMSGQFSSSLIESSKKAGEFQEIETLAKNRIFTGRRKTELEVYGRNVIHRVLSGVYPVLDALHDVDWNPDKLSGYNKQLVRALDLDLRDVKDSYSALHSLTDFVSGMTDRYAVKIADMLHSV